MDETDIERNDKFGLARDSNSPLKALLFRALVPGCINWHPDESQAQKLLDGLRLLPRFANNPKLKGENHYAYLGQGRQPIISCFTLPKGKPHLANQRPTPDSFLERLGLDEGEDPIFPQRGEIPVIHKPKSSPLFVFRIDLVGTKPPIWRRISLASDDTFFNLHLAIQAAFGWDGNHLHDFQVRNGRALYTSITWRDFGNALITTEVLPEHSTRLDEFFKEAFDDMNYTYHFGDNWDHLIKLEKIETDPSAPPVKFIKGSGHFHSKGQLPRRPPTRPHHLARRNQDPTRTLSRLVAPRPRAKRLQSHLPGTQKLYGRPHRQRTSLKSRASPSPKS